MLFKIPLLSMGPEVDVRNLKFQGKSDLSGEFFVEDVTPSNSSEPTRRLVFQSINPLIQTEALLKTGFVFFLNTLKRIKIQNFLEFDILKRPWKKDRKKRSLPKSTTTRF